MNDSVVVNKLFICGHGQKWFAENQRIRFPAWLQNHSQLQGNLAPITVLCELQMGAISRGPQQPKAIISTREAPAVYSSGITLMQQHLQRVPWQLVGQPRVHQQQTVGSLTLQNIPKGMNTWLVNNWKARVNKPTTMRDDHASPLVTAYMLDDMQPRFLVGWFGCLPTVSWQNLPKQHATNPPSNDPANNQRPATHSPACPARRVSRSGTKGLEVWPNGHVSSEWFQMLSLSCHKLLSLHRLKSTAI